MAKVTRKRLARGTKLTADHIQTPLADIAAQLNTGAIEHEQMEGDSGSFRINLHIPYLAGDFPFAEQAPSNVGGNATVPEFAAFAIPFTLPPTQEMFDAQSGAPFVINESQPHMVLEEVSFSFDQMAEPTAIKDHCEDDFDRLGVVDSGKMDFDQVSAYDLSISLLEKPQEYFEQNPSYFFQKTVFSAPVSAQLFQSDVRRFNPFLVEKINATISPFKTYAFLIKAPALGTRASKPATRKTHALVSVQISMKIRSTLMQRDLYHAALNPLQNWPTKDSHIAPRSPADVGQPTVVTPPAAGAAILADTGSADTSVSLVMGKVDEVFRKGLKGGVDTFCEPETKQVLLDDSCYEVIALPLMNNRRYGGIASRHVTDEPYCANQNADIWDRRVFPLHYPFAIHHVVLAWNWNRFTILDPAATHNATTATNVPASNTFTVDVGVGIGEGIRSDGFGYQQVAALQLQNPAAPHQPSATWSSTMFDRMNANPGEFKDGGNAYLGNGAMRPGVGLTGNFIWEWELHSVPLVRGADNGTGYFTQGPPVFAGKSWTPTSFRTNIGGIASAVAGREEFIEVRMKISDTAPFPSNDDVVSGYQGHWIYIIGKKFLTR